MNKNVVEDFLVELHYRNRDVMTKKERLAVIDLINWLHDGEEDIELPDVILTTPDEMCEVASVAFHQTVAENSSARLDRAVDVKHLGLNFDICFAATLKSM